MTTQATTRHNKVIGALEAGEHVFATFSAADPTAAIELTTTKYDTVVFEMEHKPWDINALRDSFQYLLSRRQIFGGDSLAPAVTPMVRIPANGAEKAQWHAKQALDLGAFGIIWPHISTVEEARNAVAACRYPRLPDAPCTSRPACAATARTRRPATGASRTSSTTPRPTSGRSPRTARSSSAS